MRLTEKQLKVVRRMMALSCRCVRCFTSPGREHLPPEWYIDKIGGGDLDGRTAVGMEKKGALVHEGAGYYRLSDEAIEAAKKVPA